MAGLHRYAVLFKTHFWDDFADRQFRRLYERAGTADVFIVVDETRGPVDGIAYDHVVRMTEYASEEEGYLRHPPGNVFWQNTDYQLYHFVDRYPEYDFVFTCEYDCTVNIDVSVIFESMAEKELSFVGERIRTPSSAWYWTQFARPYYPEQIDISGRLLCCAAFSRDFAKQLQLARRDHSRRALAKEFATREANEIVWPNNEAFVGTELARTSAAELPLSAFGDTSHYDWAPPFLEIELPHLSSSAFVHPVLDGSRFLRSLLKRGCDLEDLFRRGSPLQRQMEQCDPEYTVPLFLRHFSTAKNWPAVANLRSYAMEHRFEQSDELFSYQSLGTVIPTNLALGRPATQSSVSRWSNFPILEADAGGGNNGIIDGTYGFHTAYETFPWWQVDLHSTCVIRIVRIFNRQEWASRLRQFSILGSLDGTNWIVLHRKRDDSVFGAHDLKPYTVTFPPDTVSRFVRVQLNGKGSLHFCECEVFGLSIDAAHARSLEAAFMTKVYERERDDRQREAVLRDGRAGHVATIGSVSIFVDTASYSTTLIQSLTGGKYEDRLRELVDTLLRADDRVLEIGTAVGAVTMAAAMIVGARNVLTFDANARIVADACRNFVYNDLADIQSKVSVLYNRSRFSDASSDVEFLISRDFWASRLDAGGDRQDIVETVRVPTACLEDQICAHRATAMICDIEGGEVELLIGADLTGIRLIIVAVHGWAVGGDAINSLMRQLIMSGFNVDLQYSGNGVAVLHA